jgi:hypothetical protein
LHEKLPEYCEKLKIIRKRAGFWSKTRTKEWLSEANPSEENLMALGVTCPACRGLICKAVASFACDVSLPKITQSVIF